jgi:hypothetical protein
VDVIVITVSTGGPNALEELLPCFPADFPAPILRRVVILADGKLRCDAQYRRVAIVARVPKQSIQKIIWADPPPAGSEGDGLLVVRTANDLGSAVVLFLRGDEVVSGTPTGYWQVPLS